MKTRYSFVWPSSFDNPELSAVTLELLVVKPTFLATLCRTNGAELKSRLNFAEDAILCVPYSFFFCNTQEVGERKYLILKNVASLDLVTRFKSSFFIDMSVMRYVNNGQFPMTLNCQLSPLNCQLSPCLFWPHSIVHMAQDTNIK